MRARFRVNSLGRASEAGAWTRGNSAAAATSTARRRRRSPRGTASSETRRTWHPRAEGNAADLSISLAAGREINREVPSSSERKESSPSSNRRTVRLASRDCGRVPRLVTNGSVEVRRPLSRESQSCHNDAVESAHHRERSARTGNCGGRESRSRAKRRCLQRRVVLPCRAARKAGETLPRLITTRFR